LVTGKLEISITPGMSEAEALLTAAIVIGHEADLRAFKRMVCAYFGCKYDQFVHGDPYWEDAHAL